MKQRVLIGAIVLAVLVLGGGYYLYSTGNLPIAAAANDQMVVSGFIESDQINIMSEISGRIQAITVNEGDRVTAGQALVRLDPALLNAQIAQAQAAVDAAQAQLGQLTSEPRPSDVAAAQAALVAAQQNDAKVRAGPTVDQLASLKAQVDNAQAAVEQAQAAYDRVGGASNPFIAMTPQSLALQQATSNYKAALAAFNDARSHPTSAELAAAQAQVQQAQAALDRLTPTVEAIAVAQTQVKQAQDALAVLRVQAANLTITSPTDGIVAQRVAHVGELATPGGALLTITQLDPVQLTIYVPETRLGQIKLGDQIGVQVDSFPNKVFTGKVIFIAPQAEFTPRNVQTKDERVNTVFAVKLQLANPDSALKPGMPADATLP
jgi:HlyD family secretion protein